MGWEGEDRAWSLGWHGIGKIPGTSRRLNRVLPTLHMHLDFGFATWVERKDLAGHGRVTGITKRSWDLGAYYSCRP